ncbi:hypothetical protein IWQ62_003432 [Dispira parvispora]|uniref:Uncharacterized protein n=1 Tax=Dispira parvispora TaxID=1520584 RepID=A0A9W8E1N2_9FUNG|nr:hypothetical protein IWQ62_003432 [Dispira parvispora]
MKVSILGFGTLVYFLTFATGVPIDNATFCKEVGQRMTPGELLGPRGLIAKIICPTLHGLSTPLDSKKEIESLSHDDLLSLYSTEMKQFGYLAYKAHPEIFGKVTGKYREDRIDLATKFQLPPVQSTETLSFQDEQFLRFPTLPQGSAPIAPYTINEENHEQDYTFDLASPYFVQPVPSFSEDNVKWVDIQSLSDKDLLNFSPMLLLSRYKRSVDAWTLNKEIYKRAQDIDFLTAAKRTVGVVAEFFPMYFATSLKLVGRPTFGSQNSVFSYNPQAIIEYLIIPNFYTALLLTRDKEAIIELTHEFKKYHRSGLNFLTLYIVACGLSDFHQELMYKMYCTAESDRGFRPLTVTGLDEQVKEVKDEHPLLEKFEGVVMAFQDSRMMYANITFEG